MDRVAADRASREGRLVTAPEYVANLDRPRPVRTSWTALAARSVTAAVLLLAVDLCALWALISWWVTR
jgi:hypothetical protein